MKAKSKRIMGLFLALVMIIGCLPFNIIETYAETDPLTVNAESFDPDNVVRMVVRTQPPILNYMDGDRLILQVLAVTLTDKNGTTKDVEHVDFGNYGIITKPKDKAKLTVDNNGNPIIITKGNLRAETDPLTVNPKGSPVYTQGLEERIAEAKELIKKCSAPIAIRALKKDVEEAEELIKTETNQEPINEKVLHLILAIDLTKHAIEELEQAKEIIRNLANLSEEEKAPFIKQIDEAVDGDYINRTIEAAKAKDAENLKTAQTEAKAEIGNLPNLSEEEKAPFIKQVDDAKTTGEVAKAVEDAKNADDLKAYKEKAKEDIANLKNLSDTEKDTYKGEVDQATDKAGVNEAVAEAKAKDAQELKEAKDKAKEDIKDLNLTPEEKTAAEKAIDDAKDKTEVEKAVEDAKAKSAANDKKDQEDKELADAKDEAKDKIDKLPNLSDEEKKEAKDKVDEATDKDGIDKAVKDAKAKDEEKASEPADKAKEEAEKAKQEAEKAAEEAKEAEEKAKEAEKAAEDKAKEAEKKAEEAAEKAKEAEKKAEEAEEKAKEAGKAAEEAEKAKEASEADPNNGELAEKAKEAEKKAKDAEKKAEEAKEAADAAKDAAKEAEEAKKAAEEEADKAKQEAEKAAEEAKEAKEAADNAQKEAKEKAKEAEEKAKALPATPEDKDNAKKEIDKLPNLSDEEKKAAKDKVDEAKTKGEVAKAVEEAKEKSEGQKPTPTPTPEPTPSYPRNEYNPFWNIYFGSSLTNKTTTPVPQTTVKINLQSKLVIGSKEMIKSVDGVEQKVMMDIAPFIDSNRTMLPIRFVAEALGFKVEWDDPSRTVILTDKDNVVKIPVDTNKIIVNGNEYESDVKPVLRNNRTMLPIGNIARALGLKDGTDIIWDGATRTVVIKREIEK